MYAPCIFPNDNTTEILKVSNPEKSVNNMYACSEQQRRQHFTARIKTEIRYSSGGLDRHYFDLFKIINVMKAKTCSLKFKIWADENLQNVQTKPNWAVR